MTPELRNDIAIILLEEAFGMQEAYARKLVTKAALPGNDARFHKANEDALDAVDQILMRLESRCSKIEG